jgi:excinuclease ABC subunit A
MPEESLIVRGAREHNLRNIDVTIPRDRLTVITGLSGSGKSSLAFDTIYAEGQRRYVESLSAYARQFLGLMEKPDVDSIEGLSPAISIEQKSAGHNPRSTVGTVTEIYDYLRLLYARAGTPHCPNCGRAVERQSAGQIADSILAWPEGTKIEILAPLVRGRKGEFRELFEAARKQGFVRAIVDGELIEVADPPKLNRRMNHNISVIVDRLVVRAEDRGRLNDSVETALKLAEGTVEIHRQDDRSPHLFSERYGCPVCGISLPELEPRHFSFNSPFGACPACGGLGSRREVSEELLLGDPSISILEGVVLPWGEPDGYLKKVILPGLAKQFGFNLNTPWGQLTPEVRDKLLYGTGGKSGQRTDTSGTSWEGILSNIQRRYDETDSDSVRLELEEFMQPRACTTCGGRRLKPESLAVTLAGRNIGDVVQLSITEAQSFFENVPVRGNGKPGLDPEIAAPILKEVRERLRFLNDVGLEYLTLGRSAESLSGGEAQRIRLATQIGSRLVGVLYILDEPSIGLHQRDNPDSITGRYLRGEAEIPIPEVRRARDSQRLIRIEGAREHNLRNLDVEIPLGLFVAVTGVSGSGKSTLIEDILHQAMARHFYRARVIPGAHKRITGFQHLDKVIDIDQSPIGRTPRSNPATYTGLFTPIRELFAELPEAKIRGYGPGRFSFNVKGGRCEACEGDGLVKIEMHFLPDVYVPCDVCKGKRYNRETLEVRFRGLSIADVLEQTVEDALAFFENQPRVRQKLQTLFDVGLGYIHLGQSATTLSGGEAQRVKLAAELSKRDTGRTFYILDEPTTGLHFEDVRMLLTVLHRLVDRGNTVLVIEHNLDVIKTADWIIDLGPEGGLRGGDVVAAGTPEDVADVKESYTGQYLRTMLRRQRNGGGRKKVALKVG